MAHREGKRTRSPRIRVPDAVPYTLECLNKPVAPGRAALLVVLVHGIFDFGNLGCCGLNVTIEARLRRTHNARRRVHIAVSRTRRAAEHRCKVTATLRGIQLPCPPVHKAAQAFLRLRQPILQYIAAITFQHPQYMLLIVRVKAVLGHSPLHILAHIPVHIDTRLHTICHHLQAHIVLILYVQPVSLHPLLELTLQSALARLSLSHVGFRQVGSQSTVRKEPLCCRLPVTAHNNIVHHRRLNRVRPALFVPFRRRSSGLLRRTCADSRHSRRCSGHTRFHLSRRQLLASLHTHKLLRTGNLVSNRL